MSEQPIAGSVPELLVLAAGAVARLRLLHTGRALQAEDVTVRHLAFARDASARLTRELDRKRLGQCVHAAGSLVKFWTPSRRHAVICPQCAAATPRPRGCDRCRRADPPLRRWLAAAATDDHRPTGLVLVLFTCPRCEDEFADPADTPEAEQ